jgi:hypothetical protein
MMQNRLQLSPTTTISTTLQYKLIVYTLPGNWKGLQYQNINYIFYLKICLDVAKSLY